MRYDFDKQINRRGTSSVKWDAAANDNVIPMWVADMDFATAPVIIDALIKRAEHGVFGYAKVPESFYDALVNWEKEEHGVSFKKEWILYTTGVVPAISAIIKALTAPGDKVVIQEPVYNCFFSSIRNNGCEISSNNLKNIGGRYEMDFEDLERKLSDPAAKVFLLCSPHNPVGRVWTSEELIKVGELCFRHNVTVISDEIHCDLSFDGHKHIPFASLGDEFLMKSVTCLSPSKTFNLAGLHVANIVAADECIRKKIDKALNVNEVCEISPFAIDAQIAAFNFGADWLEELKAYLYGNYEYLSKFMNENFPSFKISPLDATYLPWIDCSSLNIPSDRLTSILLEKAGVWLNSGTMYGAAGEGFLRMNIACPRKTLEEGLERIKRAL